VNRANYTLTTLIAGAGLAAALLSPAIATAGTAPTARAKQATAPVAGPAVVVFSLEGSQVEFQGTKLAIFPNPSGCHALPPGAHVIDNLTRTAITLYLDPACVIPAPPPFGRLKAGFGAHVTPLGSFEAP
jgi:hypothetical protein